MGRRVTVPVGEAVKTDGITITDSDAVTLGVVTDVAVMVTVMLLPVMVSGAIYVTLLSVAFINDPHAVPEHPVPVNAHVTPPGVVSVPV